MIIGITGPIATGKSSIARQFNKAGFVLFDADAQYKQLYDKDADMRALIFKHFNTLDKASLLQKVINNKTNTHLLNEITHPFVIKKMKDFLIVNNGKDIVLDVPIPVHEGFLENVDFLICTMCTREEQIMRLKNRYNINEEEAVQRIQMQNSFSHYLDIADLVMDTSNIKHEQLDTIIQNIKVKVNFIDKLLHH